jgi:hypothetical protein
LIIIHILSKYVAIVTIAQNCLAESRAGTGFQSKQLKIRVIFLKFKKHPKRKYLYSRATYSSCP